MPNSEQGDKPDELNALLEAFANAHFDCGEWDGDYEEQPAYEALRVKANECKEKLIAYINGARSAERCSKCGQTPPFPGGTRCQDLQCPLINWAASSALPQEPPQRIREMLMGIDIETEEDVRGFWTALLREINATPSAIETSDDLAAHNRHAEHCDYCSVIASSEGRGA